MTDRDATEETVTVNQNPQSTRPDRLRLLKADDYRLAKLVAAVAGLLGFVLAALTPILPIDQKTSELHWPQNDAITNVTAPMVAFVPTEMDASVPCALARDLPAEGGVLLSTVPRQGRQATARGLFVRATDTTISMIVRDVVLLSTDRAAAQRNPDCRFVMSGDGDGVTASIEGVPAGDDTSYRTDDPDMRPQIIGVFSDLPKDASRDGLSLNATVDTRFVNSPTPLKLAAIIVGIIATLLSLLALGVLDARDGRGHRRFLPAGWFTIRGPDVVVFAVLALWWLIGGNTSDDGYNITVARITEEAGYADNYFRYFGVPQDPFGWHFQVLSWMTNISVATPWLRLPAFLLGLLGWWIISREILPRLGRAVRNSPAAVWTGAMVFLAIWMPYNNGIRPEPAEAVGALLTWACVERAIATRRLLPYAIAAITAAFTLALAPGGLMAAAALVAGLRGVVKGIVGRRHRDGLLPMIAPIMAAGTAVLFMIFYAQALAPLLEGNKVATEVGPTEQWWQEPVRYYFLMLQTGDGTFPRRFGILMMILALLVAIFRLASRHSPNGIARAPMWRLIAVIVGTMFFTSFTPTKWTHHFGIYAAIGAALCAAVASMMSPALLRSRRNRAFFASAVLLVTAVSAAGTNMWWYVGSYGVPWWDRPVAIAGINLSWIVLFFALVTAGFGLWYHFRDDYVDEATRTESARTGLARFKVSPLPVIAGLLVLFMLASFAKGAWVQRDSWSWTKSNVRALTGDECGLANDVLVEADPNAALLKPAAVDGRPAPSPRAALAGQNVGFTPDGVPADTYIDPLEEKNGPDEETDPADAAPTAGGGTDAPGADEDETDDGTVEDETGTAAESTPTSAPNAVRLPYGLDPATTPVLGSYRAPGVNSVVTDWYDLGFEAGQAPADKPLVTVSAAGSIEAVNGLGGINPGRRLVAEFGRREANGKVTQLGRGLMPIDAMEKKYWRNMRFALKDAPPRANLVRLNVLDDAAAINEWVAFTPPRVPALRTLNEVVGRTDPVFIDWMPGLVFPCQRPMAVSYGILEVPDWRIMPDAEATKRNTQTWSAGVNGGPLGITEGLLNHTLVSTYLRNNWGRDWGGLERFSMVVEAEPAEMVHGTHRVSGLYNPAPMRSKGY
ncbi:arabinosyltransferase domain-containing protein [Gordonia sp. (in: high G+C Gram-positive bacteria)]|uniref:arabinosyltransferase domain-containing protein n=1 Tax=Gordonia sp. (in: high G+C Gram-positive bacteria) TaxID=84139 RepID=UPI0016A8E41D|nr:arabinosyltransferase domain-containing protein [Gordonia sp. (in: high G+C Gram-positive bacteria)]NLG48442.1 arabinosyltransferase [Gordonia sp. (in: high G+C Gram-positive bacteria)]